MRMKAIIASSALAVASLTLPAFLPVGAVHAAASLSVSLFYDQLSGNGDWVEYDNRPVFVPAGVGADWRPYTDGH